MQGIWAPQAKAVVIYAFSVDHAPRSENSKADSGGPRGFSTRVRPEERGIHTAECIFTDLFLRPLASDDKPYSMGASQDVRRLRKGQQPWRTPSCLPKRKLYGSSIRSRTARSNCGSILPSQP